MADQLPKSRTVVLRKVNTHNNALLIHTDNRSGKIREIEDNKHVSLLFYSKDDKVQIRIEGDASIHSEGKLFEKQWKESRPLSKRCYLVEPGPGASIEEPIIEINVKFIEWLNLHSDGHIRAKFEIREDGYKAQWMIP